MDEKQVALTPEVMAAVGADKFNASPQPQPLTVREQRRRAGLT
jgi:hypothetical protein